MNAVLDNSVLLRDSGTGKVKNMATIDESTLDVVWDILPLLISIMVIAVVFGAIGGLFGKLNF